MIQLPVDSSVLFDAPRQAPFRALSSLQLAAILTPAVRFLVLLSSPRLFFDHTVTE
jgi:hypothetical protein